MDRERIRSILHKTALALAICAAVNTAMYAKASELGAEAEWLEESREELQTGLEREIMESPEAIETEAITESAEEPGDAEPTETEDALQVEAPKFEIKGVFDGRNVTMSSATEGAVIYYKSGSSGISLDDEKVENGETIHFRNFYGTIYAKAYKDGSWSSASKFVLKIPIVNTPVISADGEKVTIKSGTPDSYICYTTDGSAPSWENGQRIPRCGGTVAVPAGSTVRAVAVRNCFTNSEEVKIYVPVKPVAFDVKGIVGGRNVTMTSATEGASIYYSTTTGSLTTADKELKNGESVDFEKFYGTVYARAYKDGKWSNVSRVILKIPTVNAPVISYNGSNVTIKTTTPNAAIYYTTDGSQPTLQSQRYKGTFQVAMGASVKAIAVRSCFTNSEVSEKGYFDDKFEELKVLYPEGMLWTNDNKHEWTQGGVHYTGGGCYAFARIVSEYLLGTEAEPSTHYNLGKIKVGDHVRIGGYHSVVVMKVHDEGITVTEGNYNSSIHWGRFISFAELRADSYYIETRY